MTFIYHKSDNFEINLKENDEKITIFQQFFIPNNKERYGELKQTLQFNLKNPNIDKIYLLNEKIYSNDELGLSNPFEMNFKPIKEVYKKKVTDKLIQINMKKRLTFKHVLDFVKNDSIKGYIVILNTDIFLDDTIKNLRKTNFHETKGMFTLLRWEYTNRNLNKCKLFGHELPGRGDSQDSWILHSNFIPKNTKAFNIEFGVPGCDNKMAYIFLIHGFKVVNNPFFIKTYHNHKTLMRNYKEKIETPYTMIVAARDNKNYINIPQYTGLHQGVKNIHEYTNKFTRMVFREDNDVFIDYLNEKIKKNENFIVPRVAGVENFVAFKTMEINSNLENLLMDCLFKSKTLTSKDRENIETELKYSSLKQVLNTMKNNAGIKISDSQTLMKYAYQYLQAFDYSELFFSWAKWGNVNQGYVADSINYVENRFGKKRKIIDSLVLDVFHYIHKPWTHALKGKKILIISPFVDSFKEKEKIREQIYGVDLFPDCEFIYLKPPQTQGQADSLPFDHELMKFIQKLDAVKYDFDVALCSCGGYGNLVVNYIYNMGKSAIYVGGVLQMYFGVYGERWLRERKEVMRMYMNNYWTRPKMLEKPKGFENVEGSAYW